MHNVRVEQIRETANKAGSDASAARLEVKIEGEWRPDENLPQFAGTVKFPQGEALFEADFPPFLGGDGRAPSPLAYCFYGAMCCYGATFATQAALIGVPIEQLHIGLSLSVDFRTALGIGETPPMSEFAFEVLVKTSASDTEVQEVKKLADERCPAIWAMNNRVPHSVAVRKS